MGLGGVRLVGRRSADGLAGELLEVAAGTTLPCPFSTRQICSSTVKRGFLQSKERRQPISRIARPSPNRSAGVREWNRRERSRPMADNPGSPAFIELTADIVSAYVSNNSVA